MVLPSASTIWVFCGQRLGLELGGQVVHAAATSRAPTPSDAGERDGETGDDHAHDRGDGDHHAEVGERRGRRSRRSSAGTDMASRVREGRSDPDADSLATVRVTSQFGLCGIWAGS